MILGQTVFLFLLAIMPAFAVFQRNTFVIKRGGPASRVRESQAVQDQPLLEIGRGAKVRQVSPGLAQIKIISYNIRWRSGAELDKLIQLFRADPEIGNAAIMGLQEVDRKKKRSNNTNTAKLIADELGLHYAWAAPPAPNSENEEETGVAVLSLFPLSDVQRIVLPHEGPGHRRRAALGVTVKIGNLSLRVYSVHSETRMSLDDKLDQMTAALQDLSRYPKQMPAIIMGDFNTWEANVRAKTKRVFTEAGFQTPFGSQTTFYRRVLFVPIQLKLDWIWLRGLQSTTYGIDRKIDVSDHWPLWINLKLPTEKKSLR